MKKNKTYFFASEKKIGQIKNIENDLRFDHIQIPIHILINSEIKNYRIIIKRNKYLSDQYNHRPPC